MEAHECPLEGGRGRTKVMSRWPLLAAAMT